MRTLQVISPRRTRSRRRFVKITAARGEGSVAAELHHVVPALLDPPEDLSRDAQVEGADAPERLVGGRRDAGQVLLALRARGPVIAREGGAALEERGDAADDRRVLDPE